MKSTKEILKMLADQMSVIFEDKYEIIAYDNKMTMAIITEGVPDYIIDVRILKDMTAIGNDSNYPEVLKTVETALYTLIANHSN